MKKLVKFLVVGISLLVVAASANAQIILESAGTWAPGAVPAIAWTQAEGVLFPPSNQPLTIADLTFASAAPVGIATYTGPGGNVLDLDLFLSDVRNSPDMLTRSINGYWEYFGGAGIYAPWNVADGDGTFAISQTINGFSGTVLVGNLYATPEPGTYAVLGIGLIGLLRARRRRA